MKKEKIIVKDIQKNYFTFPIIKLEDNKTLYQEENVVSEYSLSLFLDNNHLNTFRCTLNNIKELVVGYLKSRCYIDNIDQLLEFDLNLDKLICNISIDKNHKDLDNAIYLNDFDYLIAKPNKNNSSKISAQCAYEIMKKNLSYSELFKNTGGVHCISIYDIKSNEVVVIREDVARHNAMDKAIGYCIINNIPLEDKAVFLSGRVSSEMISKAATSQIPIVISKSAPTNLTIEIAKKLNITLACFVRDKRMSIFSNPERIIF